MPLLRPYRDIEPDQWWPTAGTRSTKVCQCTLTGQSLDEREYIRQWILREIIETYHYPFDWLGTRIVGEGCANDGDQRGETDCFGLRLMTQDGDPFLIVSVTARGDAGLAEEALKSALLDSRYAGVGVATDGTEAGTRFLRRRFDSDKCEYVVDLDMYVSPSSRPGPQPYMRAEGDGAEHDAVLGPRRRALMPLSERVEGLFFDAHSYIRDIDGLHADEALDELCKVLYVKLYDEEAAVPAQPYRAQRWLYGCVEELATAIRSLYERATAYDTRVYSLKIPGYARSRGVFNTPIRLSSAALAKLVDTLQDYDIVHSSTDVKGRAFQKVLAPSVRAGMGQYFTPDPVVKFMVAVCDPSVADLVLDPFCGSAHMLTTCLQHVHRRTRHTDDRVWYEFAFGKLHGIEKSDRMVRVAMTDMRLQGDGHSNIRCTDALLDLSNYPDLERESFDLIVTNPPFGSALGTDALARLGAFDLAEGRRSVPLEVLGLERCIQFLRPGGRLAIVLPDGVLANRSMAYVRQWADSVVKLRAIVSLPLATFVPFGASIKTSIVFARKWHPGERHDQDYDIFLARLDNVGYDASGRPSDGAEFDAVATRAAEFLSREGW